MLIADACGGNRTVASPVDEPSTLQRAAAQDTVEHDRRVAPVMQAIGVLPQIADACAAARPDLSDIRDRVQNALTTLEDTYQRKLGAPLPAAPDVGGLVDPEQWVDVATEMTGIVASTPVLFVKKHARALERPVTSVRDDARRALAGIDDQGHRAMVQQGVPAAEQTARNLVRRVEVPEILGRDPLRAGAVEDVVRGLGPLTFTVGHIRCEGYEVLTRSIRGTLAHPIEAASSGSPVAVDLDRDGGFVTTSAELVESVVHNLLTVLSPANLRIRVVDPVQLGRSVQYLHRLGDQASVIIGNKAVTSSGDLAALLHELEDHIAYVTQRYLQGDHTSLTQYNEAAGEIAEPYRVVVMHDLEAALSRGTEPDPDMLARLTKIAQAGRRCGVFLLVHRAGPLHPALARALGGLARVESGPIGWEGVCLLLNISGQAERSPAPDLSVHARFSLTTLPAPSREVSDEVVTATARQIAGLGTLKIGPRDLTRTMKLKAGREATRSGADWSFADPADPTTWWRRSSALDLRAPFGRAGAQDVGELVFACDTRSNAIVAGVPGSGKSVWLHAVIMALVLNYGPEELELYLVDFKEGVEFNQYALSNLRHARVVAVESERDFGVSVLENLEREIERRAVLFKQVGGNDTNLTTYRERTGETLPRVLLVMDEFQRLFERDDAVAARAGELLDQIVRQGRAFGVHVLMASQTLSGNAGLRAHTLDQIPTRVALKASAEDSRRILAEDNPDAALMSRPGEGILNTQGGRRDANERFQTIFWEPAQRSALLERMHEDLANAGRGEDPWVFNGADRVPNEALLFLEQQPSTRTRLNLPLGMPFLIGQDATVQLTRTPAANPLLVGREVWQEATTMAAFARADRADVRIWLTGGEEDDLLESIEVFAEAGAPVVWRQQVPAAVAELADLVSVRVANEDRAAQTVVVVVPAAHRLRDPEDPQEASAMLGGLSAVLSDGPDVGVHVVLGFDRWASVARRLNADQLADFGIRICGPMGADESRQLTGSDAAARLREHQLLLMDAERRRSLRVQRVHPLSAGQLGTLVRSW